MSDHIEFTEDDAEFLEENNDPFIPIYECQDRGVYRIIGRSIYDIGVFDQKNGEFIGVREKFGDLFLFSEEHWDMGAPHGTVKPKEKMGDLPNEISITDRNRTALFDFLHKAITEYNMRM
jgi:hypothetical protein